MYREDKKAFLYRVQETFTFFPDINMGKTMISYGKKNLRLNEGVFEECMKLQKASEQQVDQIYLRAKKRLSRMLQQGDSYDDLIWLICKRIGL